MPACSKQSDVEILLTCLNKRWQISSAMYQKKSFPHTLEVEKQTTLIIYHLRKYFSFFLVFFFVFVFVFCFFCSFFFFLLSESMCLDCIIQSLFWKQNVLMILHRCCICCWVGCRSCWSIHMFRMTWCHVQKLWLTLLWEHLCTYYIAWKLVVFGVFLIRIFPHWDWIRRDNPFLPVFSPNAGKYRPEKLQIPPLFTQSYFRTNSLFDAYLTITITW